MKYTIFTGMIEGKRFFDCFTDLNIETWEDDYSEDERYDFEYPEDEIKKDMKEEADKRDSFEECLRDVSDMAVRNIVWRASRDGDVRDLIQEKLAYGLRELVVNEFKADCLIEVEQKYREEG